MINDERYPQSKQLKAELVDVYWLTTASWDTGYGPTYETGIRNKFDRSAFWLVQHCGSDWMAAHEFVKKQILASVPPYDVKEYES